MRKFNTFIQFIFIISLLSAFVFAQDDSGLPRMIGGSPSSNPRLGEVTISGRITIQGLDSSQPKPSLQVAVYANGTYIDRKNVQENGTYYFENIPSEGATIVIEVDKIEVSRQTLLPIRGNYVNNLDFTVTWLQAQSAKSQASVISLKNSYQRSSSNQKLFDKALSSSKNKKYDSAITDLKEVVANDPKDFVAWTELGTVYFSAEKLDSAEESYKKAIEQKPDFILALINLGKVQISKKAFDDAIVTLTKATTVEALSADAHHYLGEAYLQSKKGSKAVFHFNEALKLAPIEKAEIHLRLASLYIAAKLNDRAVNEYKLFLEKVPSYNEKKKIEQFIKDNSPK
jgi:tetratricopeptide (TPR) repeat protein